MSKVLNYYILDFGVPLFVKLGPAVVGDSIIVGFVMLNVGMLRTVLLVYPRVLPRSN